MSNQPEVRGAAHGVSTVTAAGSSPRSARRTVAAACRATGSSPAAAQTSRYADPGAAGGQVAAVLAAEGLPGLVDRDDDAAPVEHGGAR